MIILKIIINRNYRLFRIILEGIKILVVAFEVFFVKLYRQATGLQLFYLCRKVDALKLRFYQIQTNCILVFDTPLVCSHLNNTPDIANTGRICSERHHIVTFIRIRNFLLLYVVIIPAEEIVNPVNTGKNDTAQQLLSKEWSTRIDAGIYAIQKV